MRRPILQLCSHRQFPWALFLPFPFLSPFHSPLPLCSSSDPLPHTSLERHQREGQNIWPACLSPADPSPPTPRPGLAHSRCKNRVSRMGPAQAPCRSGATTGLASSHSTLSVCPDPNTLESLHWGIYAHQPFRPNILKGSGNSS